MTTEAEADIAGLKRIGSIVSRVLQEILAAAEPGMTMREQVRGGSAGR
jgi:methionyl aminopeptidase